MDTPLLKTPLFDAHRASGARIVDFAGWAMPVQYSAGVVKEHHAVRTSVGLFDVSHMGRLRLRGAEARGLIDHFVTNDVRRLYDGKACYALACNEQGRILDDLIVYRGSETDWWIVCNASNRAKIAGRLATEAKGRCAFEDETQRTALIALQGPEAASVLRSAGAASCAGLRRFHFADATVVGVACTVARTGYTGEDGFEIVCQNGDALGLWSGLLEAGNAASIQPIGLGARDTLRLEACLPLYGNEIDETTEPFEAGLGWVVKLEGRDFVGRAALLDALAHPSPRRLVGFKMAGRGIARHGYPLQDESGAPAGTVTSGSPSPTLGGNIGLGYVRAELAEPGNRLGVEIRGKVVEAVVAPTPFYKRRK